jgi:hypothetical protein
MYRSVASDTRLARIVARTRSDIFCNNVLLHIQHVPSHRYQHTAREGPSHNNHYPARLGFTPSRARARAVVS